VTESLAIFGLIILAAAVIGGGLRAKDFEVPVIDSLSRQVLLGGVGILALTIALIVTLRGNGKPSPRGADSKGSTTSMATQNPTGDPSSSTPQAASPSISKQPIWRGEVRIGRTSMDLDATPPQPGEGSGGDVDAGETTRSEIFVGATIDASVAAWRDSTTPSRSQCEEVASTQAARFVVSKVNGNVCLKTDQGHIALLEINRVDSNAFYAMATIWPSQDGT
jgi:hypothetical protein